MSLNLQCKEVQLRQTPTEITERAIPFIGKSWVKVLSIYLAWWIAGAAYEDEDCRAIAEDHLEDLLKAIRQHGKLTFFYS